MGRAPCCEKVGLKKGKWTAEEDEKLVSYIKANGEGSWRSLPKKAGLLRCGKSCRLRWINYLKDDLKRGNISSEEEETIIKLQATLGNRWSVIAAHLRGRTDNEIKNHWNSHLSKKIYMSSTNDDGTPTNPTGKKKRGRKPRSGGTKKTTARQKKAARAADKSTEAGTAHQEEKATEVAAATVVASGTTSMESTMTTTSEKAATESRASSSNGDGGQSCFEIGDLDLEVLLMEENLWDSLVGDMLPGLWEEDEIDFQPIVGQQCEWEGQNLDSWFDSDFCIGSLF